MLSEKTTVFVGASFNALLMAYYLAKKNKSGKIIVVEKDSQIGGLYRSFKYDNDLKFDIDVHIYTETCNPVIDSLVHELLPENEWIFLSGKYRDVSGTYFNGKLQTNTPFVDLRSQSEEKKSKFLGDMFTQIKNDICPNNYKNTKDFLVAKFGNSLYEEVFKEIIYSHYKTDAENLDPFCTHVIPVGRVVLYDEDIIQDLMNSSAIRSRMAYPDQFSLPDCFLKKGNLIYPRKYGIYKLVEELKSRLEKLNVEIHTNTSVEDIQSTNKTINSLTLQNNNQKTIIDNVEHLYWNGGYPILANKLGHKVPSFKPEFRKSAFVNLVLDKPPNMSNMYYSYCFDKDSPIFRITNYYNYCPDSVTKLGYPICVTLWLSEEYEGKDLAKFTVNELKRLNLISDDHKVNFAKVETIDRGFPNPTSEFISQVDNLREQINNESYKNLGVIGMLAKKNHFYLTEALEHGFSLLT